MNLLSYTPAERTPRIIALQLCIEVIKDTL